MNEWGLEMAQQVTAAAALPRDLDSQHLQEGSQLSRQFSSLSRHQAHTLGKKKKRMYERMDDTKGPLMLSSTWPCAEVPRTLEATGSPLPDSRHPQQTDVPFSLPQKLGMHLTTVFGRDPFFGPFCLVLGSLLHGGILGSLQPMLSSQRWEAKP